MSDPQIVLNPAPNLSGSADIRIARRLFTIWSKFGKSYPMFAPSVCSGQKVALDNAPNHPSRIPFVWERQKDKGFRSTGNKQVKDYNNVSVFLSAGKHS